MENREYHKSVPLPFPAKSIYSFFSVQRNHLSRYRHSLNSVFALASGNFLSALLGALGGLLVARYLGPDETGLFRVFTIPMMYLTFLHLGTFDGLHRQIPFYIGRDRVDEVERVAAASGAWNMLVACLVSAGFLACAAHGFIRHDTPACFGWLTQAIVCWGVFYTGYLGATYRTVSHFVAVAKIQVIQTVTAFLLVFTLPILDFYGLCLRAALPSLLAVYLYHRSRPLRMSLKLDLTALKGVVAMGLPFCFWGTLETSLWMALENTLLLKMAGVKELGLFSVVVVLREGLAVVTRAVHQVLAPRMVEQYARDESLRRVTRKSVRFSALLVVAMLVCVPALSLGLDFFVPLAIPKYLDGIGAMKASLWVVVVEAASLPLNALYATGRAWLYGRGVLVGLVAFVAGALLLASPVGGLLAVVLGSLAGRIARVAVCYLELFLLVRREVHGRCVQ